jgi:Phospholipase_D-nuclease N-terminal
MGRLLPFLVLADIALIAMALFDCVTTEPERVRSLPKRVWILLIIVVSPIGGIAWFVNGRVPDDEPEVDRGAPADNLTGADTAAAAAPAAAPPPARVLAPDDDPEFLRQLEIRVREARRLNKDQPPTPPLDE